MTDTMIERVARAICQYQGHDPDIALDLEADGDICHDSGWRAYTGDARAAIAAMRELTEGMVNAYSPRYTTRNAARAAWTTMIDAALKETSND